MATVLFPVYVDDVILHPPLDCTRIATKEQNPCSITFESFSFTFS
jgi:hypothetical protein